MNDACFSLAEQLVSSSYIQQAQQARRADEERGIYGDARRGGRHPHTKSSRAVYNRTDGDVLRALYSTVELKSLRPLKR